ncbi:MAG: hypothetical protein IRZ33_11225, partial [Alicyclobacillaceae bacterium]|nr:hypothetical protein [Alicyclobacillaceae bacterium]
SRPVIVDRDIDITLDGQRRLVGWSGGEFQAVDEDRYAGVVFMPMANMQPFEPLPERFTLRVHVARIGDVTGPWDFTIPVSRQTPGGSTRTIHTDVTASSGSVRFSVRTVDWTPVDTIVEAALTDPAFKGQMAGDGFNPDGWTSFLLSSPDGRYTAIGRVVGWSPFRSPLGLRGGCGAGAGAAGAAPNSAPASPVRAATGDTRLATVVAAKLPPDLASVVLTPLQTRSWSVPLPASQPVQVETPAGRVTVQPAVFQDGRAVVRVQGPFRRYRGQLMADFTLGRRESSGTYSSRPLQVQFDPENPGQLTLVFPGANPDGPLALGIEIYHPAADLEVTVPLAGKQP